MIDIIKYFLNFFFFNYLHERALVFTIAHTHKRGTQSYLLSSLEFVANNCLFSILNHG